MNLRSTTVPAALLASIAFSSGPAMAGELACENLAMLDLPNTTITSAEVVPASPTLRAYCKVVAVVAPQITIETWLPIEGWNGKFLAVGNGGYTGSISAGALAAGVARGYAAASTDTGHSSPPFGGDQSWMLDRGLVIDWGYRSVKEMAKKGKAITRAFYSRKEQYSYFNGCSTGGRQALIAAQRFPEEFAGIIAGAPANFQTHQTTGHTWRMQALEGEGYIPTSKLPLIADAVNAACDALDGIQDGVLDDPRQCKFDPTVLRCMGADAPNCLTASQVDALNKIYSGARNPRTGKQVFPGTPPGGEVGPGGWQAFLTGTGPRTGVAWFLQQDFFSKMVFANPAWDFRTFDFDSDVAFTDNKLAEVLNATDPDLRGLKRRGKLILYHGWSDPGISPLNTVNYYESVVSFFGGRKSHHGRKHDKGLEKTKEFARLFLAPGMQHCSGGPGPNTFDMLPALEGWVERGIAPDRIIASHMTNGVTDRTRPLCPYPEVARYTGQGSTDEAVNFVCKRIDHDRR
ncbi:MAG TPA: tannase/feruloyl esterase family alpha/beta hydrolase [Candidatus Binatia bacterium]|nr:tannase/feruloyl esterase family alpha/beta hydrolase [Candidatus Binatia bacterium]